MIKLPHGGFVSRMRLYLAEMYPIPARLVIAGLLYLGFASLLQRIHHIEASFVSRYTLIGVWSVFSLLLILRLMDELKDLDVDRELFCDRPVPSGRVLETDIVTSLVVVMVLFVAANLSVGPALWVALVVLGYALLMFRYFFIPDILRKYLLLNLATHNPIIPIMFIYVVILFSVEQGLVVRRLAWLYSLLAIALYWAPSFAWEIARKIRASEEETAYVTYSQILGRRGAVLTAGGAQTLALAIGLYLYRTLELSGFFAVILLLGYGIVVWGHARFLLNPNPMTSKLRPFAEGYMFAIFAASLLEHVIGRGSLMF
ncbi:MAG: hypothetical protein OEN01_10970 [Candidatus Krumholzibacteria bacterium]|nr:hypothetical protein [Candidatus Krumholzibacteria bacterium]